MKTIWKFPLILDDEQEIDIPEGAMITDFRHQFEGKDTPTFWAIIDTKAKIIKWKIYCFGTGHNADLIDKENLALIGTLPFEKGLLMFHFFYKEQK